MLIASISVLFVLTVLRFGSTIDIFPWETYLELGSVEKPLGLTLNQSSFAHRHFMVGYLCLHSFLYESALQAFQLAIDTDPSLVEAHIGRLLGHKHALWSFTNQSGGLQVWNDTWSLFNEYNVSLTPIQAIYLNTAYQWFSYENISHGEEAFLASMFNLTTEFPSNIDGQIWLGLAYLTRAYRENVELKTMEPPALLLARKILQAALIYEPTHPGCLHYLIHAFDVPSAASAQQAVPYAYRYGQIVITASHGQHMPTHIWTRTGAWSLAQAADIKSVEASLMMCMMKQQQQFNYTNFVNKTSPPSIVELVARLNLTQSQNLLYCDRENRPHSQQWLVYSYLQTGRYRMSVNVLNDLYVSNQVSPSDKFYLPYIYAARAFIVTNVCFWAMYEKEKNQEIFKRTMNEILVDMDSNPIQNLVSNSTDDTFFKWTEALARFVECIRLLFVNENETNSTTSIEYHLSQMIEIASTTEAKSKATSIRIFLLIYQTNALRWCLNGSFEHCLMELAKATRIESSFGNDHSRPYVLHIRSAELFALYLLIIHRYHHSLATAYVFENTTVAVKDFPSYALRLYTIENQTDSHRAVNSLGMARAYAELGRPNEASEIYGKLLQDWSQSTFSLDIDRMVIQEATDYVFEMKINQIKSDAYMLYSSLILIAFLFGLLFVNQCDIH